MIGPSGEKAWKPCWIVQRLAASRLLRLSPELWQADAKRYATGAEASSGIGCGLSCLRPWSQHGQQRVRTGNKSDCGQTRGINSLRTGNDDRVADLNICKRDCG